MNFTNNPKKALMLIMSALVLFGFAIASVYYKNQNKYIDPRIIKARELYQKYNAYTEQQDFGAVFSLLDSVEAVYQSIDYYKNSYETGVLYNNRAAAYLSMAIYADSNSINKYNKSALSKDSLLNLAQIAANKSIAIYEKWIQNNSYTTKEEIIQSLAGFKTDFNQFTPKEQRSYLKKRVIEIQEAQLETPRRLSVAYTNLGIILRHKKNYKQAIEYYNKALKLWNENLAAENSMNILLGKPIRKRTLIQKLFPPDKSK